MPTANGAEKHNLGSGRGRKYFDSIKSSGAEALLSSAHTLFQGLGLTSVLCLFLLCTPFSKMTAQHLLFWSLLTCYLLGEAFPHHLLPLTSALRFSILSNSSVKTNMSVYVYIFTCTHVHTHTQKWVQKKATPTKWWIQVTRSNFLQMWTFSEYKLERKIRPTSLGWFSLDILSCTCQAWSWNSQHCLWVWGSKTEARWGMLCTRGNYKEAHTQEVPGSSSGSRFQFLPVISYFSAPGFRRKSPVSLK